jgi:predicted phage terminase large subunit-like protein
MIARGLGQNPSGNYLYITASDELRSQTSVAIRDIITTEEFRIMYGVEMKKDQNAKNLWRTTMGGGLKTATIFGQITGFGAGQMIEHNKDLDEYLRTFEGCIVLDDINKVDDSENITAANDKVSRVIFNTVLSRKNSKDTPIINIQQRVGMEDATYHLNEHYKNNPEKVVNLVLPVLIGGKPLWEYKHTLEDIELLRTSPKTSHTFETQYMQNPQPLSGLLFKELNYYNGQIELDKSDVILSSIDVADEGSDKFAQIVAYMYGNELFIHDVVFTDRPLLTVGEGGTVDRCISLINEHKPNFAWLETNMGGSLLPSTIRPHLNGQTALISFKSKTNKHQRIVAMSAFIMRYFRFRDDPNISDEYSEFIRQIKSYQSDGSSKHDDAPDCCKILAEKVQVMFGYLYEPTKEEDKKNE